MQGKLLWWSDRDENGVIVCDDCFEYYFDRSVLKNMPKKNVIVNFKINRSITDCLCAKDVFFTNVEINHMNFNT